MSTRPRLAEETTQRPVDRRWMALAVIALAQLMIALDATMNIQGATGIRQVAAEKFFLRNAVAAYKPAEPKPK